MHDAIWPLSGTVWTPHRRSSSMAYALEPSRTTKGEDSSGGSSLHETTFLKRLMGVVSIKEADLM